MDEEVLNVAGKYWINLHECCAHGCCTYEAPNNFSDEPNYHVCKQPENEEEERQCRTAMEACPVAAIRDDGEINLEAHRFQT